MKGDIRTVIRAQSRDWYEGVSFVVYEEIEGVKRSVYKLVELSDIEPGSLMQPTFTLGNDEAQAFLNELWRIGIRPSNGEGSVGQLGATERHLADMRKIAFSRLNIDD